MAKPGTEPARTLSISSPAIPVFLDQPALEPVRLSGTEGLNGLFEYHLLLKTPDALNLLASDAADWDLDSFIGREMSCSIELDGAGQFIAGAVGAAADHVGRGSRQINAVIASVQFLGEEGRHLQFLFTLRPWLHLATHRTDCRIFQNKTVIEILDVLLSGYAYPVDKRLIETYPVRDYQTQFNETDFDFFERLCQENGISYFFEHGEQKHRLVLIDNMGSVLKNPSKAYQQIDYHPPGWKVDAEYIHSFVPHNQLTSGRYTTSDYDYTRPRAKLAVSRKDPRPTGQADAEVYQWHASHGGSHYAQPQAGSAAANDPQEEGRQFALLRMQALRTHGSRARASGNLRAMVPGCSFALQGHPRAQANAEYLILDTRFLIEDVGQDSQIKGAAAGRSQQWKVEVDFTAHPMREMLRPELIQPKPRSGGPQTALVVGPEGENLWTDSLGRIKVQFPWDRIGQNSQHSSCWVRVSSQMAGNQLGAMQVPRIGEEVLVDFIGGDPDLPLCTGRLYNQLNLPPWALPGQAALSGFRSRELTKEGGNSAAGRSNHLVLDDTDQKIQAQLKSDHQHSQLSLGHISRIEDNAGRKDARGEGFELATGGRGAIRTAEGLLITTEGRPHAQGHTTDMGETAARLTAAHDQHEALSEAAHSTQAQEPGDQDAVAQALKAQNDAIRGKGTAKAGSFPELAEPHLVLASPAGIATTTAQSTHIASVEHTALTSGGHTSISAGKSLLVSVKKAIRFFALKDRIKVVAARQDVDFEALRRNLNLLAKLDITVTANKITINATEEVVINGAGSYSRWNGAGIEHGTQGRWVEHAGAHSAPGPRSLPVRPMTFAPPYQARYVLQSEVDGRPLIKQPYRLQLASGRQVTGQTNDQGQTLAVYSRQAEDVKLHAYKPPAQHKKPWSLAGGGSAAIEPDYLDDAAGA